MRLFSLLCLTSNALAAYEGHARFHRHYPKAIEKSSATETIEPGVVYAPGPTVVVFELDGQPISQGEVDQGIKNGTLVVVGENPVPDVVSVAAPHSTPHPDPSDAPAGVLGVLPKPLPVLPPPAPPRPSDDSPDKAPENTPETSPENAPENAPNNAPDNAPGDHGLEKEFPSGLPCDKFPIGYGAIPIDHLGLGGWIGIQNPAINEASGFGGIVTTPVHTCTDGNCCVPGAFCSYSCPIGYLKTSWPKKQGVPQIDSQNGQKNSATVGGLYCNAGTLEMGDGSIAKTLCIKGTDKVTVRVQNNLTEPVSLCQTDYPGE